VNIDTVRYRKTDLFFLIFLFAVLGLYAVHLFSFTVFEGFSTFANDSSSYIRLARNWSPYSEPAIYNLQTLPAHPRAPGFPWLLAITGGAESTYAGHLLVSITMLVSIALCGWLAYRHSGLFIGGALTISFCLLPGVIISSMGILSENPYLLISLTALLLYSFIRKNHDSWPGWFFVLFLLLSLSMLTRTTGIALSAALFVVALLDHKSSRKKNYIFMLTAATSFGVWLLWNALGADDRVPGQLSAIRKIFGSEDQTLVDRVNFFLGFVSDNLFSVAGAWNHYLSLTNDSIWFFLCSFALFAVSIIALALRAFQWKPDALYVCFYLVIIALWPFPGELVRFLHPIVMLLLLQPLFYFHAEDRTVEWNRRKIAVISVIILLLLNSLIIQHHLIKLRYEAETNYPQLVHSVEFYDRVDRDEALRLSALFRYTMVLMQESVDVIPPGSTVAAVKPEAYMLFAERESVMLITRIPYLQQLCNFKIRDVNFVLLSPLFSSLAPPTGDLVEQYRSITTHIISTEDKQGEPIAHILALDPKAIDSTLNEAEYECQSFQFSPD
jgi:hypothetical protein